MSFEEEITSKDNYSCIFPKPNVVYCLYYPSNILAHSESSGAKKGQNKTRSKTRRLLGAFWTSFLISSLEIEEKRSISKFLRQTGVISCERALSADNIDRIILGHVSRFHQSRAREIVDGL